MAATYRPSTADRDGHFLGKGLALRPRRWSGAGVSAILGFLWAWIAVVYHLAFFARISVPAHAFAAVSMAGRGVRLAGRDSTQA